MPDGETPEGEKPTEGAADDSSAKMEEEEEDEEEESLPGCTLFIKNLNFDTTEETLKAVSGGSGVRAGTPALSPCHSAHSACLWRASWQCVASHHRRHSCPGDTSPGAPSGSQSSWGLGGTATRTQGPRRAVSGGPHPAKAVGRVCVVCLKTKPLGVCGGRDGHRPSRRTRVGCRISLELLTTHVAFLFPGVLQGGRGEELLDLQEEEQSR